MTRNCPSITTSTFPFNNSGCDSNLNLIVNKCLVCPLGEDPRSYDNISAKLMAKRRRTALPNDTVLRCVNGIFSGMAIHLGDTPETLGSSTLDRNVSVLVDESCGIKPCHCAIVSASLLAKNECVGTFNSGPTTPGIPDTPDRQEERATPQTERSSRSFQPGRSSAKSGSGRKKIIYSPYVFNHGIVDNGHWITDAKGGHTVGTNGVYFQLRHCIKKEIVDGSEILFQKDRLLRGVTEDKGRNDDLKCRVERCFPSLSSEDHESICFKFGELTQDCWSVFLLFLKYFELEDYSLYVKDALTPFQADINQDRSSSFHSATENQQPPNSSFEESVPSADCDNCNKKSKKIDDQKSCHNKNDNDTDWFELFKRWVTTPSFDAFLPELPLDARFRFWTSLVDFEDFLPWQEKARPLLLFDKKSGKLIAEVGWCGARIVPHKWRPAELSQVIPLVDSRYHCKSLKHTNEMRKTLNPTVNHPQAAQQIIPDVNSKSTECPETLPVKPEPTKQAINSAGSATATEICDRKPTTNTGTAEANKAKENKAECQGNPIVASPANPSPADPQPALLQNPSVDNSPVKTAEASQHKSPTPPDVRLNRQTLPASETRSVPASSPPAVNSSPPCAKHREALALSPPQNCGNNNSKNFYSSSDDAPIAELRKEKQRNSVADSLASLNNNNNFLPYYPDPYPTRSPSASPFSVCGNEFQPRQKFLFQHASFQSHRRSPTSLIDELGLGPAGRQLPYWHSSLRKPPLQTSPQTSVSPITSAPAATTAQTTPLQHQTSFGSQKSETPGSSPTPSISVPAVIHPNIRCYQRRNSESCLVANQTATSSSPGTDKRFSLSSAARIDYRRMNESSPGGALRSQPLAVDRSSSVRTTLVSSATSNTNTNNISTTKNSSKFMSGIPKWRSAGTEREKLERSDFALPQGPRTGPQVLQKFNSCNSINKMIDKNLEDILHSNADRVSYNVSKVVNKGDKPNEVMRFSPPRSSHTRYARSSSTCIAKPSSDSDPRLCSPVPTSGGQVIRWVTPNGQSAVGTRIARESMPSMPASGFSCMDTSSLGGANSRQPTRIGLPAADFNRETMLRQVGSMVPETRTTGLLLTDVECRYGRGSKMNTVEKTEAEKVHLTRGRESLPLGTRSLDSITDCLSKQDRNSEKLFMQEADHGAEMDDSSEYYRADENADPGKTFGNLVDHSHDEEYSDANGDENFNVHPNSPISSEYTIPCKKPSFTAEFPTGKAEEPDQKNDNKLVKKESAEGVSNIVTSECSTSVSHPDPGVNSLVDGNGPQTLSPQIALGISQDPNLDASAHASSGQPPVKMASSSTTESLFSPSGSAGARLFSPMRYLAMKLWGTPSAPNLPMSSSTSNLSKYSSEKLKEKCSLPVSASAADLSSHDNQVIRKPEPLTKRSWSDGRPRDSSDKECAHLNGVEYDVETNKHGDIENKNILQHINEVKTEDRTVHEKRDDAYWNICNRTKSSTSNFIEFTELVHRVASLTCHERQSPFDDRFIQDFFPTSYKGLANQYTSALPASLCELFYWCNAWKQSHLLNISKILTNSILQTDPDILEGENLIFDKNAPTHPAASTVLKPLTPKTDPPSQTRNAPMRYGSQLVCLPDLTVPSLWAAFPVNCTPGFGLPRMLSALPREAKMVLPKDSADLFIAGARIENRNTADNPSSRYGKTLPFGTPKHAAEVSRVAAALKPFVVLGGDSSVVHEPFAVRVSRTRQWLLREPEQCVLRDPKAASKRPTFRIFPRFGCGFCLCIQYLHGRYFVFDLFPSEASDWLGSGEKTSRLTSSSGMASTARGCVYSNWVSDPRGIEHTPTDPVLQSQLLMQTMAHKITFAESQKRVDARIQRAVIEAANARSPTAVSCRLQSVVEKVFISYPVGHWAPLNFGDYVQIGGLTFECSRFMTGVACLQGHRLAMEDEEVVYQDLGLSRHIPLSFYAVYDGHGGSSCASFLRKELHRNFVQQISYLCGHLDSQVGVNEIITESLYRAFVTTDRAYLNLEQRRLKATGEGRNGPGGVAVVVVIAGYSLWCANSGDSRAVLSRRGTAIQLSLDHKPDRLDECMRIEAAGGHVKNRRVLGRLAVSRAFGDIEYKCSGTGTPCLVIVEPEVRHIDLSPTDEFIVIACDGLFDVMTSQNVVDFVRKRLTSRDPKDWDVQKISEALVYEAIENRKSRDNVSAIIVCLDPDCKLGGQCRPGPQIDSKCCSVHEETAKERRARLAASHSEGLRL